MPSMEKTTDICVDTEDGRQPFAVFDFDGTILEGHSPVMLVKSLLARKVMPKKTVLKVAWWAARYKLHLPHEQAEVRRNIFDLFTDQTSEEVDEMMERLYTTEVAGFLRADALEAVQTYKRAGVPVILVSASFEPIVKRAADGLGADAQLSTRMEIVDGKYTGECLGLPVEGEEKIRAFRQYADARCGAGNWRLIAAYGDHHSDIPLLEAAERAVAVTPDSKLRRAALNHGWEIVNWS